MFVQEIHPRILIIADEASGKYKQTITQEHMPPKPSVISEPPLISLRRSVERESTKQMAALPTATHVHEVNQKVIPEKEQISPNTYSKWLDEKT